MNKHSFLILPLAAIALSSWAFSFFRIFSFFGLLRLAFPFPSLYHLSISLWPSELLFPLHERQGTDDFVDRLGKRTLKGEEVNDVDDEGIGGLRIFEHREEIGTDLSLLRGQIEAVLAVAVLAKEDAVERCLFERLPQDVAIFARLLALEDGAAVIAAAYHVHLAHAPSDRCPSKNHCGRERLRSENPGQGCNLARHRRRNSDV